LNAREVAMVPSTCWECSNLCGSLVSVQAGQVLKIAPNPGHAGSKGAFCVKGVRGALEWTYQDQRLRYPLRRDGPRGSGQWQSISWDDAFAQMADAFCAAKDQYGARSIIGAVSGGFFSRGAVMALLMRSIGSPNWMINQDLCGGCRAVSDRLTGLRIGGGEDIENTHCALIVGRNPQAADPIQWLALKRAKARGAGIIVIDPFRTGTVELADLWLRPLPGTDSAIALAMIRVMIEEKRYDADFVDRWCHGFDELRARADSYTPERASWISGVAAADIVSAARMYADGPSTFVSGHGIDAFSAGVQTFRAFHSLVAISGNLDRPGGNPRVMRPKGMKVYHDLLHDPAFRLDAATERQTIGADKFPLWAGPNGWQTACHNPSVINAILTGEPYPIRAMYVSGVNIVVTYPNTARTIEALQSLDFLAVATQTMTPTAAFADIILPKTTALEEEEITIHPSTSCVTYTAAVAARADEVKPDIEIAAGLYDILSARGALAAKLLPWRSQAELNAYLLQDSTIDLDNLKRTGFSEITTARGNFAQDGFATPSGKIELFSETLNALGLDAVPGYTEPPLRAMSSRDRSDFPLALQTGLREKTYHHSRFREQAWAKKVSPDPIVYVNPKTADEYDVIEGDWIFVEARNSQGRCRMRVTVSENTLPGILTTGMGWWNPSGQGPSFGALDINVNAVLDYDGAFDPATGSVDTRGIPCRIVDVVRPDRQLPG
jgi:thiosulfate reductase/polysulfide reductase chain A